MINIPSTVPTSNTEGLRVKHVPGERVSHVEKLQNVTDKPASRKMPRKNSKKQEAEKHFFSQEGEREGQEGGEKESENTYQRKLQSQERRGKRDRRKNRSKNFLFDSRSSNTRRSHDAQHPSVDIEV